MSDDPTKEVLGELHEAEPSAEVEVPPEWFKAWSYAFEHRVITTVISKLEDLEEKFSEHVGRNMKRFNDEIVGLRTELRKADRDIEAKLKNAMLELHAMLEAGGDDPKLATRLAKIYRRMAHELERPEFEERNGGVGGP